jgi:hypothetical protein
LLQAGHKVFSFQIAQRSAQLEPSKPAPWIDVPLDSFPDLVASKMVALVRVRFCICASPSLRDAPGQKCHCSPTPLPC